MCHRNGVPSGSPMTMWVTSEDSVFAGVQGTFDSFGVVRHARQEIAYQGVGIAHSSDYIAQKNLTMDNSLVGNRA